MNQTEIFNEVKAQVHEQGACRIELAVQVGPDMIQAARKKAIKSIRKDVTLPGFRKGKAPEETILKKYPDEVEKQLHKELADIAFLAAQKIVQVPRLNNNAPITFDLKKINAEGAELLYSFETEPKIPTVDPAAFVKKPVDHPEVTETQIEEAIRQMRFFYAQWTPVVDRPIQDGDYIMIDLDTVEGESVERVFHHIRFEVSKDRMADWMKKLVEGAKVADVLEGVSEADATASDEEKAAFKPKNVRITILKAETAALPELNDEFANKVGAPNIAEMRESVANLLKKRVEEKVQGALKEQVNQFLIDQYLFDLPQSLIDTESKHRFNQMMHDAEFKNHWDKISQNERKELAAKLSLEAAQAVRLFYLSRGIVQNEKIPVTHQEVQNEAIHIYQTHGGKSADQLPKEIYALALSKVILAKAQDYILKKA